jgi:hypothetical protein
MAKGLYVGVDWADDHVRRGTARTIFGTDQDWREVLEGRDLPHGESRRGPELYNPNLYLTAYGRIYRNAGATTPGTTPKTVDGMSLAKIKTIIDALRFERYRWARRRRACWAWTIWPCGGAAATPPSSSIWRRTSPSTSWKGATPRPWRRGCGRIRAWR